MKLEMKDVPGQLLSALKPVSEVGGNIIAVIHQRDPTTTSDVVDVQIMLEVPDQRLDQLIDLIRRQGVNITRINEERLLVRHSVLLIGHLMHTNLSDTVDRIDSSGYAEVAELSVAMPAIDEPSSAKITLKATNLEMMKEALDILREIAVKKELLMIEPLEDDA